MTAYPGVFVVLEGGDGAGKTTQLGRLAQWLRLAGREVVTTFEPGDTVTGAVIRKLLLSRDNSALDPRAEALLYAADKAQHLAEVVVPALARGDIVVSDRYVDSMIAYQGAGRVLDLAEVTGLTDWATDSLVPDLTVVLDVDVTAAVGAKTDQDRIEAAGVDFHERVRQHFLQLAAQDPDRYLVLPGRDHPDRIEDEIRRRVEPLLPPIASEERDELSVTRGRLSS